MRRRNEVRKWGDGVVVKRAVVVSSFRGADDSEWLLYLDYVRLLSEKCQVLMIQAVNPFHLYGYQSSNSYYEADTQALMSEFGDDCERFANDLVLELPPCCLRAIRAILVNPRNYASLNICEPKLIEAGILRKADDGFALYDTEWSDAFRRKIGTA